MGTRLARGHAGRLPYGSLTQHDNIGLGFDDVRSTPANPVARHGILAAHCYSKPDAIDTLCMHLPACNPLHPCTWRRLLHRLPAAPAKPRGAPAHELAQVVAQDRAVAGRDGRVVQVRDLLERAQHRARVGRIRQS